MSNPQNALGRANHGRFKTSVPAKAVNCLAVLRVCNVRAVPCQQILYPVRSCDGNVKRIHACFGRQLKSRHKLGRKYFSVQVRFQHCDASQERAAFFGRRRIPLLAFLDHERRHVQVESSPMGVLPLPRGNLIGRNAQVPAGTRCEVTEDGCFKIRRGPHSESPS